jgi:hypothetical protein
VLRRPFESAAVVLLAAIVAACAPTVDGTNTARQAFHATIVDPQGLVQAASNLPPQGELVGLARDAVHPLDHPNAIWVTWDALPCETRPSLELSQAENDRITIELDRGPREADVCALMSAGYGVRLVLKAPVEAEEIAFSIVEDEDP